MDIASDLTSSSPGIIAAIFEQFVEAALRRSSLSDAEVEDVVNYVISQQKAQYSEEMIPDDIPEVEGEVTDELYHE
ncbi:hypothetical protein JGX37_16390, partial [Listeria monocytogenes]|nr:hypothetical protein [Listeria monocytogenes]